MERVIVLFDVTTKDGRQEDLFVDHKITVVTPIRCYTSAERSGAPADSNAYFGG